MSNLRNEYSGITVDQPVENVSERPEVLQYIDDRFSVSASNSTIKIELFGALTTFISMVYSIFVIPGMLASAGMDYDAAYISTVLVASVGCLAAGLFSNLPMAIGSALSLSAYISFVLILGKGVSVEVALGAVFVMGVLFTLITVTGVRNWILANLPAGIAHGTGVGIGLFLLLIAVNTIGLVSPGHNALPIEATPGAFTTLPVILFFIGLAAIIALEKKKVPGAILIVVVAIAIIGNIFDPNLHYAGLISIPDFTNTMIGKLDIMGAMDLELFPIILALTITACFDATGTVIAVAKQAGLINKKTGYIKNASKVLLVDSSMSIFAGLSGGAPAAVYAESASGTAVGAKTGLSTVFIGLFFLSLLFFAPIAKLVPVYAAAPALGYVGLLMLLSIKELCVKDSIESMSGLATAVFILLTANIVTGITIGFATLILGRVLIGEFKKVNFGTLSIGVALVAFNMSGIASGM